LRAEGVTVTTGSLGELEVDFGRYGWFPDVLPSEEGQDSGSDTGDESDDGDDGDGGR
jgi:methylated-DNA-protein-cysteine methyltransferase related protein